MRTLVRKGANARITVEVMNGGVLRTFGRARSCALTRYRRLGDHRAVAAYAARDIGDIKKLRNFKLPTWRLRVGRYRVLYRREGQSLIVVAVNDRKDAYR